MKREALHFFWLDCRSEAGPNKAFATEFVPDFGIGQKDIALSSLVVTFSKLISANGHYVARKVCEVCVERGLTKRENRNSCLHTLLNNHIDFVILCCD